MLISNVNTLEIAILASFRVNGKAVNAQQTPGCNSSHPQVDNQNRSDESHLATLLLALAVKKALWWSAQLKLISARVTPRAEFISLGLGDETGSDSYPAAQAAGGQVGNPGAYELRVNTLIKPQTEVRWISFPSFLLWRRPELHVQLTWVDIRVSFTVIHGPITIFLP